MISEIAEGFATHSPVQGPKVALTSSSVDVQILSPKGHHGLTTNQILETALVITKHIYTGDNTLELHCYNVESDAQQVSRSASEYHVESEMSSLEISSSARQLSFEASEVELEDTSIHTLASIAKQIAILRRPNDSTEDASEHLTTQGQVPVLLSLSTQGSSLCGILHHPDTQRHREAIPHIIDTMQNVCQSILYNWSSPISTLSFLGPLNLETITKSMQTPSEIAPFCVHDILIQQAATRPESWAIDAWDGSFTYAQLHRNAVRLAAALVKKGVEPGERIPICLKKSKWALVAMFGIFLSGATCVPLDVRAPQQRIEMLIQRLGSRFVIADSNNASKFQATSLSVLSCEVDHDGVLLSEVDLPKIPPSAVAFIYFTSGSTGIPKGVVLEHGNLYATIQEIVKAYSLDEKSRLFQYASYVFDVSMGDNFGTLAAGGTLCIPSEEQRLNDPAEAVNTFRATHACFTNTVISQMDPGRVPTLQHLFIGGEALDKAQFLRWRDHANFNGVYGLTESLIWDVLATTSDLMSDNNNLGRVTIGPCLWVVDPSDSEKLKPIGAIGEILIEGPTLARGYMDDPETTAAKFIRAPKWLQKLRPTQETRAYKSGDMGFMNSDGSVTFAGRADTQVKLRGQRIELGEIEHSIRLTDSSLGHVVVEAVLIPSRGNTKTLAAFFSDTDGDSQESPILSMTLDSKQKFLQVQQDIMVSLPQYMVPSLYIPVREMPRAVTGKLDRKTLKQWAASIAADKVAQYYLTSATFRAPDTVAEKCLQQVWSIALGIPEATISAEDNFFQLGGDSIGSMQLVALLRERGNTLSVDSVFQSPRLCEMASILGLIDGATEEPDLAAFALIQDKVKVQDCVREVAQACKISSDSIEDILPTTPIQEALMAISAHRPTTYRHQVAFRLPESIETGRFKVAVETLVQEQAIFRTRIVIVQGFGSVQAILRPNEILSSTNSSLDLYLKQDRDDNMTYGTPLSRFSIIENKHDRYFVYSCHHSVYDAWSRTMMYDEIQHIYQHGTARPQVPYSRFIYHVTGMKDTEEAKEFWRSQFPDILEKYPRLPSAGYVPQPSQIGSLDMKVSRRAGSSITVATVIQAAWAIVTARQAGTNDALFGLPLSGRDAPVLGVTKMMAPTISTVPVRVNIDNTVTVSEFLQDVQKQVSQVKSYQHVGLQSIRHLSPEASSAVDFKNLLVIHPDGADEFDGFTKLGMQLAAFEETDSLDLPLTVQCTISAADKLSIKAHYDDKIVPDKQLECLLHQFKHVISQLTMESTALSIYDLDMMSSHDWRQYAEWHASEPRTVSATLHGMFKDRVLATPDAMAVSGFDGEYSYRQLDTLSNQLAYHLSSLGVTIESRVVLCFSKSTWPIVAMLATLKCGAVCVSVNPAHPDVRILEICEDVEAKCLLCDEKTVERFSQQVPHVVAVNQLLLTQLESSDDRDLPEVLPSNASFIVYTSGSTGKPKGSILEHQNLCTSLTAVGANSDMNSNTRTLQFSAYTFDAHILEIFGTFIHGGCVCVISDDERMNRLEEVIHQQQMNWSLLTPTVARLLSPEKVPSLGTLILSGEPLAQRDMDQWVGSTRLLNGLGPSECSILCCITDTMTVESDVSNIGIPIGCHVWITDRRRPDRLVPLGCTGELVLEGPILGRGYVNRPKATAAAFIKDPAWSRDGTGRSRRFYRTGDLARLNLDGSISFVGRADTQVKIRGQRVELGEIEHKLKIHSQIVDQVAVEVIKIASRGDTQVLAAFVACKGFNTANSSVEHFLEMEAGLKSGLIELQGVLANVLPRYMIPSLFLPVEKLPISPSGKLERKLLRQWACALESQDLEQYFLREDTVVRPPQTDNEKKLHKMWVQVLKIPANSAGIDDNFFQLGGDSVTAMEMITVARGLGLSLTVADVFRFPRLCEMAETITISKSVSGGDVPAKPFELISKTFGTERCLSEAAKACQVDKELIEDVLPATPIQEALMAVTTHRPRAYTHQAVFELPPSLDIERFKSAWETLVAAQAIFRTRIVAIQAMGTLQVVLRFQITWLTGASLEYYLEQDQEIPMTHDTDLSRFAIVSDGTKSHFVLTLHHATYDGWSLNKTLDEIKTIYQTGTTPKVAPYSNFLRYLTALDKQESEAFWQNQFPDIVQSYPQLPSSSYKPAPRHKESSLMQVPARKDTKITIATMIQAAWSLLMARYTGDDRALFGLTLSGRDTPVDDITHMIGPTLSTVPMRISVDQACSVGQFLQQIQLQVANVREHQHTGLQNIRRLSTEARAAVDFQNLVVIQTIGDDEIASSLGALGLKQIKHEEKDFLNLALTLECIVQQETVLFNIQFDDRVVPAAQTKRLLTQLQYTISVLSKSGAHDVLLHDLDLVSADELRQLDAWNDNIPDLAPNTVHGLVDVQVQARPEAIAVNSFDGSLTYKELNSRANTLAAHLTEIGVGPEAHVMLCFQKSSWAIIAQLAVLKAGGCCVSLNAEYPDDRLLDICSIVGSTVMLCDAVSTERFIGHVQHVEAVDSTLFSKLGAEHGSHSQSEYFKSPAQPHNAAFVIYTSGSTGKPKGVVLEHGSLNLGLTVHSGKMMDLGSETKSLQFAAYSFDASLIETFGALALGGTVCVVSDEERMDIDRLVQACNDRGVNWSFMTPSLAQLMPPSDFLSLQTLVLGGEMATRQALDTWEGHVRLLNGWGPSETTIFACHGPVKRDLSNIGHATACRLWVVEDQCPDRLVPIGCVGELLVEGPLVGRGYLNNPQATEGVFIKDPAWSKTGAQASRRMYRTGDLARMNADGTVCLLGRRDTQVKIRGQRVELSEIEFQIRQTLPAGSEVIVEVVPTANKASGLTVVAFVKLEAFTRANRSSGQNFEIENKLLLQDMMSDLERALSDKLPQFMIPSSYIPISKIATTVSGKTDRKYLRQYAQDIPREFMCIRGVDLKKREPTTEMEKILQSIWSKVLNYPSLGIDDTFTSLGGDSILAMQAVTECRKLNIRISVSLILSKKTIYAVAPLCVKTTDSQQVSGPLLDLTNVELKDLLTNRLPQMGIETENIEDVYPCSAMQEGILLSQQKDADTYQITCIWEMRECATTSDALFVRLEDAWKLLVARHSTLRTGIYEHASNNGHFVQVTLKEAPLRFSKAQERLENVADIANVSISVEDSFWAHLPRLTTYHLQNDRVACRMDVSHVMIDGMSLDMLVSEFVDILAGKVPRSPKTDYGQFVRYEQSLPKAESVSYWTKYLRNIQPCHLPIQKQDKSSDGDYGDFKLSENVTKQIGPYCKRLGLTPAALIQAAWSILLGVFTGSDDVCFGYVASARDAPVDDIETSIGLYISMQVCRVILNGAVEDAVNRVQEDIITGLDYRNCSLASIQNALGLGSVPLFNTCLTIRRGLTKDKSNKVSDMIDVYDMPDKSGSEYAIALNAIIDLSGVHMSFSFPRSQISQEFADSIGGSLEAIIQTLTSGSNPQVNEVEVLSPKDHAFMDRYCSMELPVVDSTIHDLVERQAHATPDAVAVSSVDGDCTYEKLNSMADALAAYMVSSGMGVGPEVPVMLCFRKSTWAVVAMLAVLKTGSFCVPIDPGHATARLLEICKDVKATVLLCDDDKLERFSPITHVTAVDSSLLTNIESQNMNGHASGAMTSASTTAVSGLKTSPNNAAFVVYTSRSTDTPKGIVLEHRALATSLTAHTEKMMVTEQSRILQFAAYAFDASIFEVFAPLIRGGCTCIVSDENKQHSLAQSCNELAVNWAIWTPSLASALTPNEVPNLKTIVFGAEMVSGEAIREWRNAANLLVVWGHPETAMYASCGIVNVHKEPSNVGHAAGCRLWVVEQGRHDRLVPVGCVGELLVEGPILSRGYLNSAEANKTFITDPAWARGSKTRRFYRSGDLAAMNTDGTVTFMGRADTQVKIHGQRVKLSEIEQQMQHFLPAKTETIVELIKLKNTTECTLTAFVRLESYGNGPLSDEGSESARRQALQKLIPDLDRSLNDVLPQHMIPTAYIPMSFMPRTDSDAIDRKSLEVYAQGLSREAMCVQGVDIEKRQPTNETELTIQTVWARILNIPAHTIGIDDTFTSIGGDSITAMQVVTGCRKANIKITVSLILNKKTIHAIAPLCAKKTTEVVQASQRTDETLFDLSPVQKVHLEMESQQQTRCNQSFLLRIRHEVSKEKIKHAFDLIAKRHDMLRARYVFDTKTKSWKQKIVPPTANCYRFATHVISDKEKEIQPLVHQASASMDIVNGPVFSVDLFEIEKEDAMMFMTAHHLVVDLVSWRIIWKDLEEVLSGSKLDSPPTSSFRNWCEVQKADCNAQEDLDEVLPLPVPSSEYGFWQVPEAENIFADIVDESFHLAPEVTSLILGKGNDVLRTAPLDIMLGFLFLSFSKAFPERGVPSILVEHHGRDAWDIGQDVEIEQTVGWFTSMYPLHVPVNSSTEPFEAVRLVKDLRRRVPGNGRPYYACRHLTRKGKERFGHHGPAEMLVNYTGIFQQLEVDDSPVQLESRIECDNSDLDPNCHRWSMIDVDIDVKRDVMSVVFRLNRNMAHLGRVQNWIILLERMITECMPVISARKPVYTLSDFPGLAMSYTDLDNLIGGTLPRSKIYHDNIKDILPLAPFQKIAIEGNLQNPPRHWDSFFIDLPASVDMARLKITCGKVVDHFDILRTIFVQQDSGDFLQVVLKSMQPRIDMYTSDEHMTDFCERLCRDDLSQPRFLGDSFLRFMILSTRTQHRLILRVSHAQFDGYSCTALVDAFAALYAGQPIPPTTGYASFVRHIKKNNRKGYKHWRLVLGESQLTYIPGITRKEPLSEEVSSVIRVNKTVPRFATSQSGQTAATVFTTACALLLSSLTGSVDVVFGRLTSGRAGLDQDLANVVGPCVNVVPVRAQIKEEGDYENLLNSIGTQSIDSSMYDTVSVEEIVKYCAKDWSPKSSAGYPAIVQYRNVDVAPEARAGSTDETSFKLSVWDSLLVHPFAESLCIAGFPSDDGVVISVSAGSQYCDYEIIEKIHTELCRILAEMAASGQ